MKKIILLSLFASCLSSSAFASELVQQFKDPAFSSYGWSAHVMAIDSQEKSRKQAIVDAATAKISQAKAEAANTPLARFMALFSSQVYSQLATQLSNNLFAESGNKGVGTFKLDGNVISYVKTTSNITLTVLDVSGAQTTITVPIAQFYF